MQSVFLILFLCYSILSYFNNLIFSKSVIKIIKHRFFKNVLITSSVHLIFDHFYCTFTISRALMFMLYTVYIFTAQCTLVHMRGLGITCRPSVRLSVRPSVTLVDCDHIAWKSWKLIARAISPTPSLFVAKRRSTYSQGNMGKFGGD